MKDFKLDDLISPVGPISADSQVIGWVISGVNHAISLIVGPGH